MVRINTHVDERTMAAEKKSGIATKNHNIVISSPDHGTVRMNATLPETQVRKDASIDALVTNRDFLKKRIHRITDRIRNTAPNRKWARSKESDSKKPRFLGLIVANFHVVGMVKMA
jgi:hypothetical protein